MNYKKIIIAASATLFIGILIFIGAHYFMHHTEMVIIQSNTSSCTSNIYSCNQSGQCFCEL